MNCEDNNENEHDDLELTMKWLAKAIGSKSRCSHLNY